MVKKNLPADKAGKTPSVSVLSTTVNSENNVKVQEVSDEERRERFARYQPTGEFEKDVIELFSILCIPVIVAHRPKLPITSRETTTTSRTRDDKKNTNTSLQETDKNFESEVEAPPVTYVLSENKEYFKARIEIETEIENNKGYIKELYLRGWLADMRVMDIFAITLPYLEKLTVLDMWNAGLTDETLNCLYECLRSSSSLKTLGLDGNHFVTGQRFDIFLFQDEKLCLQNLSLRNCKLDEIGALHLGNSLTENINLLTLNLCYNTLADEGAKHLAECLRLNRTLLSLNIGSNGIGDEGVKYISEALTTFPLSHDQVVARRMLKSFYYNESLHGDSSQDSSLSTNRQGEKKSRGKTLAKKAETSSTKGRDTKLEKTNSDAQKNLKGKRSKPSSKSDRVDSPLQNNDDNAINPLLEKVRNINGELWISANRTLINLNLSRNKLTKTGLDLLNAAMIFQVDLALENNRVTGCGLMKLNIQNNSFCQDDPTYISFNELMKKRNPFYKPPISEFIEENT